MAWMINNVHSVDLSSRQRFVWQKRGKNSELLKQFVHQSLKLQLPLCVFQTMGFSVGTGRFVDGWRVLTLWPLQSMLFYGSLSLAERKSNQQLQPFPFFLSVILHSPQSVKEACISFSPWCSRVRRHTQNIPATVYRMEIYMWLLVVGW